MAAAPPFTRIYLETEPLRASNWPKVPATLENLLSSVTLRLPTLSLYLPIPVEEELEAQFLRDYIQATQQFANSPRTVNQLLVRAERAPVKINAAPLAEEIRQSYRQRV